MRAPSDHPLIRALHRPLLEELRREVRLTLQVALLKQPEFGYSPKEIEQLTKASRAEIRVAVARLQRVAPQIERE